MLASVFTQASACGGPAGAEPPCTGGIYRDVADMLVLMAVFAFGWMLFSPGTRLGVFAVRFLGYQPPKAKAAALAAEREAPCNRAGRCRQSSAAGGQRAVAAGERRPATRAGADVSRGFDCPQPHHGERPPPIKIESLAEISQALTPSTCTEAALDELLGSCSAPSSGSESGEEGFARESWGFNWDFEATEGSPSARKPWAPAPALEAEEVDSRLRVLAAGADLAACWGLWHAMPPGGSLGEATIVALASAVERGATSPSDAEYALEVAEVTGSAQLAEAALSAGMRLRSASWLARALPRLYAAGMQRRPHHTAALARAYGRERRADLAVELWRRESRGEAASPMSADETPEGEEDLYAAALEACTGAGDFEAAARLARGADWRAPRSAAGQSALLALARWLARRQDLVPARRCTAAVRAAGGAVDLATLRALLAASARCADMPQACTVFDEILGEGLAPDMRVYAAMIQGYCAVGSLEKALSYFDSMREAGVEADTSIFDAILSACASRSTPALAEKVFADMEAAGVRPSNATLCALVRLHGAAGDLDRALAVFEDLPQRHDLEVSSQAYGALVTACLAGGRRDLALEALHRVIAAGGRPSARTYESLISSCASHGDLDQAVSLVDEALVLESPQEGGEASPQGRPASARRALLDTAVVEDLLRLIGRRRQARRLGAPLLERLQAAGFAVSDRLAESLLRSAASGGEAAPSPYGLRQAERRAWCRDFASAP